MDNICQICETTISGNAVILNDTMYHPDCLYPKQRIITTLPLSNGRLQWSIPLSNPYVEDVLLYAAQSISRGTILRGKVIPRYYRVGTSNCTDVRYIVYSSAANAEQWTCEAISLHISMFNKIGKIEPCRPETLVIALLALAQGVTGNRMIDVTDVDCNTERIADALELFIQRTNELDPCSTPVAEDEEILDDLPEDPPEDL